MNFCPYSYSLSDGLGIVSHPKELRIANRVHIFIGHFFCSFGLLSVPRCTLRVFFVIYYWIIGTFSVLWVLDPYQTCALQIFTQISVLSFHFFDGVLWQSKGFHLMKSNLSLFFVCAFDFISIILLKMKVHEELSSFLLPFQIYFVGLQKKIQFFSTH